MSADLPSQRSIPPMKLATWRLPPSVPGVATSRVTAFWWCVNSVVVSMLCTTVSVASASRGQRKHATPVPWKNIRVSSSCVFITPALRRNGTDVLSCHGITSTATPSSAFRFRSSPSVTPPPSALPPGSSRTSVIPVFTDHPAMYTKCRASRMAAYMSSQRRAGRYFRPPSSSTGGRNPSDRWAFWYSVTLQFVRSGKKAGLTPEKMPGRTPASQHGSRSTSRKRSRTRSLGVCVWWRARSPPRRSSQRSSGWPEATLAVGTDAEPRTPAPMRCWLLTVKVMDAAG